MQLYIRHEHMFAHSADVRGLLSTGVSSAARQTTGIERGDRVELAVYYAVKLTSTLENRLPHRCRSLR